MTLVSEDVPIEDLTGVTDDEDEEGEEDEEEVSARRC